jgi:hypothetical protein
LNPDLVARTRCGALVITCSDFRFKTLEREFELSLGLCDDHDLIARPGGIRSIVAPRSPAAAETIAEEIRLLYRVHAFTRIIAVNHMSCRAYDDLTTEGDEREVHTDHLRRAKEILDGYFPGTTAEIYLQEVTPSGVAVNSIG